MTTEAKKVDVLVVMRHAVSALHGAADKGAVLRHYADSLHEAKQAVAELIESVRPFARRNSSEPTVPVSLSTEDVTRLRAALAVVEGVA